MTLEIYKDTQNEWRWRLRSDNNRIQADGSESYKRRSGIKNALCDVFRVNTPGMFERDAFWTSPVCIEVKWKEQPAKPSRKQTKKK